MGACVEQRSSCQASAILLCTHLAYISAFAWPSHGDRITCGRHVFRTEVNAALVHFSLCPGFKSQVTMSCCVSFGRWLSFSVPQVSRGVLFTPFLTGWLGSTYKARRPEPSVVSKLLLFGSRHARHGARGSQ